MRNRIAIISFLGIALSTQAQMIPATGSADAAKAEMGDDSPEQRGVSVKSLPKDLLQDQIGLFSTPFHMKERQWKLAVPMGLLITGLVASDTAVEGHVTKNPSTVSRASTISNAGVGALLGIGGIAYLSGKFGNNESRRETGFLSGEAALDAYLDTTLIKYVAGRDRPFTANGRGKFFDGGSSFPSQHAAVSWAVASVIAHEYPGPLTKMFSYGLAGAVSVARVEAHQHFVSDAVIGSALGWYLGRQVYRARSSDADIDFHNWGKFEKDENSEREEATNQMGSSYVPVDSWVYDAYDRLAAMGYLRSSSAIIRPWTRTECARLLQEAHDSAQTNSVAEPLLSALDAEFAHESDLMNGATNAGARVEDVYARFTGISGTPLRDSFHFAQTIVDDFGRPYGQGANAIAGFTAHSETGPFAFYMRGEYQYASALSAYSAATQQTLAAYDGLPYGWNLRSGTTSRVRPVEAYAALNMSNWQFSFGQQSLWWGPDRSTSMILSNNAEAMPMLRVARVKPLTLPSFLAGLGPTHVDFYIAREGGIHYVRLGPTFIPFGDASHALDPAPYMWGVSFSIKPTANFELGFGHTAIFAGYGRPLNLKTFVHTFSILGNAQEVDPGKRTTEFNLSYHVPGLRNWLVVYSEGFAYDNPVEGKFVARFAFNPGVYFPQIPGLRKLDLRLEGVNTNLPKLANQAYFYSNTHYPQGYTNYGQILGSWIGRQGTGGTATSTYWFSAHNKAAVTYRKMVADSSYLQGGNLQDVAGSITWRVKPSIELSAMSQYETWNFPLLAAGTKSDVTTSFGIRFFPKLTAGRN